MTKKNQLNLLEEKFYKERDSLRKSPKGRIAFETLIGATVAVVGIIEGIHNTGNLIMHSCQVMY